MRPNTMSSRFSARGFTLIELLVTVAVAAVLLAVAAPNLRESILASQARQTARAAKDAIDYARLKAARVSNVVATLRKHGRNHLLVIESASGGEPERVRGVISRAQVERQLGTVIEASGPALDLAEIAQAMS